VPIALGPMGATRTGIDIRSVGRQSQYRRIGSENCMDRLLTVDQAGELLNTGPRFVRRLIAERRIEFVHVGRHVRISESALLRFVEAGSVPVMPIPATRRP
jgi:excisionase family DNA binding protein